MVPAGRFELPKRVAHYVYSVAPLPGSGTPGWSARRESNAHACRRQLLRLLGLPIPPRADGFGGPARTDITAINNRVHYQNLCYTEMVPPVRLERTTTRLRKPALYPLSYGGMYGFSVFKERVELHVHEPARTDWCDRWGSNPLRLASQASASTAWTSATISFPARPETRRGPAARRSPRKRYRSSGASAMRRRSLSSAR